MDHRIGFRSALLASAVCSFFIPAPAALAQEADPANGATEQAEAVAEDVIIVTARRRNEGIQDVPVVVTAIGAAELDAYGVDGLEDISTLTPGLTIDGGGGAATVMSMRGVTTGGLNTSSDQAIAINIDGVQFSSGEVLRSGQYDLEQVEVLKGPQALFFGKNSPGGIISLRTSDPTDDLFVQARAGYEFEAEQKFGELAVSGPLSETLGARVFFRASDENGPYTNLAPTAIDRKARKQSDYFGRLTLTWAPDDVFDARFKLAYGESDGAGQGTEQRFACAPGGAISGPIEDCVFDRNLVKGAPDPRDATLSPLFRDEPESRNTILLGSLEANLRLSDALTLTSLTGYFDLGFFNYDALLPILPPLFIGGSDTESNGFSQELRLTSDFSGAVNFMLGGFLDWREYEADAALLVPGPTPPFPPGSRLLFENTHIIKSNSSSVFGQLQWDVTDTLELSGGARYTTETKRLSGTGALTPTGFGLVLPGVFTPPFVPTGPFMPAPAQVSYDNISPEVTLAWRPSDSVLLFAAYKEGFKSGGFNNSVNGSATLATVPADQSFAEETVDGFEIGVKFTPDRGSRINLSAFRYEYNDLQLSTFDLSGGGISTRVVNTGAARTQGLELDGVWQPKAIDGLTLAASLTYLDTEYVEDVFFQCNGMQIAGLQGGCDFVPGPAGIVAVAPGTGSAQNLRGLPLLNSPKWAGNARVAYESELGNGLRFGVNAGASYSAGYHSNNRYDRRAFEDSFWLFDAGISVGSESGSWSLDLIGRNLSDKIYRIGTGGVVPAGGTIPGVSPGEMQGPTGQPRSILLQLTLRPFGG